MQIKDLKLVRPLLFFDLETTGVNVVTDRIVQIAAVKYEGYGEEPQRLNLLINPGRPIPAEVVAIHGISDEKVADAPLFEDVWEDIYDFFEDTDLSGYNHVRFDIPLLMEEFHRVGATFSTADRNIVDAQHLFYKMEPRTLSAALRFYQGEKLENAHDAMADVEATVRVLEGQLAHYAGKPYIDADGNEHANAVQPDMDKLHKFLLQEGQVDGTNKIRRIQGEYQFNFGKHKGKSLREVFKKEPSYYDWIQKKEFTAQVKQITKQVWDELHAK